MARSYLTVFGSGAPAVRGRCAHGEVSGFQAVTLFDDMPDGGMRAPLANSMS